MDPYVQEYHAWKAKFALTNPKSQLPTSAHAILWCLSRYPNELNTMSHFLRIASLHHTSIQEKCKEMRAQKVIEVARVCGATRAYVYALHASVRPSATAEEVDCSSIPRRNAFLSILEYLRRERESEGESGAVNRTQQQQQQATMALDTLSAQRQPAPLAFINSNNNNNNNNNSNNNDNNSNSSSSSSVNMNSFNSAIAAAAAAVAASSSHPPSVSFPSSSSSSLPAVLVNTSPASSNANADVDNDVNSSAHTDAINTISSDTAAVNSSIAIVAAAASTDLSPSATTTSTLTLTQPYTNTQSSALTHAPSSGSSSYVDTINMNSNVNNNNNINSILTANINASIGTGAHVPLTAEHLDRSLREHMQRRFAPHFDAATDALKVSRYALTVNSSERVVFQRVLEIFQRLQPCGACWLAPNELTHKTMMEIKSGITRSQMKKLTSFAWEGAEAVVVRHDPLRCESSSEHSRCCRPSHLCFGPKSAQQRDSAISAALRIHRLSSSSENTTNVTTAAAAVAEVFTPRNMTTPQKEVQQEEMNAEGEEEYVSLESYIEEANGSEDIIVTPQPNRKRSREEQEGEDSLDDTGVAF